MTRLEMVAEICKGDETKLKKIASRLSLTYVEKVYKAFLVNKGHREFYSALLRR